jgi:two-component system, NtrC family, nitrogen regulation sensor histidine kinase NtrY
MKLRTQLAVFSVVAVCGSLGVLAWSVNRYVRRQFADVQRQEADTLVAQSQREFLRRGDEVSYALQGIAEAEGTLRMAIDLSRPQSDPSLYARDARGIATSRQLDFLEFVRDDGTLISSAQWPGRLGFKNDWVTQRTDWDQQKAFLAKIELPDTVDLGLLAVRIVAVGDKKLYIIGGRRLDSGILQALTVPEGMQVFFYRNLESAFAPDALADPQGPASQPERFTSLIETMQRQPRAGEFDIPGTTALEKFMALPLTGQSNELLAAILVGAPQTSLVKTSTYIRNATLVIGVAGILLVLIFSWLISRQVSVPLERLARAARELGAGRWNVQADARARGEAGRAVRAFNEMSGQIAARREKLVQAERVAAWRELARNFAVELKLPLYSLQVTLESLSRAREQTPEQFDETFWESMKTATTEVEHLKGIVARFSDLGKLREPRKQAVDVNEIVRAAVTSFEPQFQLRGRPPVNPELSLDENAPKISADAELLYKGFENVIANSVSAMSMGGTLTIRTGRQNGSVCVEISDTRGGMDRGKTADSPAPYAAKVGGAGLGLATIQTVVSDHEGRMSVETTATGTTFRMEFPVALISAAKPEPESATSELKGRPKGQPKALPEPQRQSESATDAHLARTMDM